MKTIIQVLYDKGLFKKYDIADKVLEEYSIFEANESRTPDFNSLKVQVPFWAFQIQLMIMLPRSEQVALPLFSNDFVHDYISKKS